MHGCLGFPVTQLVKNLPAMWDYDLWVGKIACRRERLPSPVFWPGEFYWPYSPWDGRVTQDWMTFTFTFTFHTVGVQGKAWLSTAWGLLGQWAYFVWYDDGCMSSYIFPTQRGSSAIKTRYKLWVIVMYQCELLSKRDTIAVNDEMRNLCTFPSISLWTLNFSKKQSIKNRARNSAPNMFLHWQCIND